VPYKLSNYYLKWFGKYEDGSTEKVLSLFETDLLEIIFKLMRIGLLKMSLMCF